MKKPDLLALQKELERDPKNETRVGKFLKRTRKQYLAVKNGFFAALVALLVESHNSIVTLIIIFIEFLQNLAFCFAGVDWGPYGNKYGYALIFFQVEEVVVEYTFPNAILVLVSIAVILIVTMLLLAFYVVQSFMASDFNRGVWPLRLLRTLVSMLASIFFLPVVYSLFSIFICRDKQLECGKNAAYIVLRIISGIALPTFIAFTLLMSMTYFNPNPKAASISARPTARLELVELTAKTALAAFFVFASNDAILRESVTLLCSLVTAVFVWIYIPYYKKEINLYRFSLISEVIWGSMLGETDDQRNIVFYTYCAGVIPVPLLAYFCFKARQDNATSFMIASKNFKVDNPNAFNTWEVMDTVKDGENERRFWSPSQVEIATRFLIETSDAQALEIADKIFLFGTKKFPQSSSLMVQYAIFFLVFKEDPSVAASYLKKAEKAKQLLIDTEFTIYQQQQEIKSGGATVGNKKLDAVDRAKLYHAEARASIANFWLAIMNAEENEEADTAILMTHVSQMERSDHNASEAYHRLIQRYPLSVRVLISYATFLAEIHNNHEESEKIRRRIKRICDAGLSDDAQQTSQSMQSTLMNKKSQKAFKEYRKQVYYYSRGNSALLMWMIRGIQVFFLAVASGQLYACIRENSRMVSGISWLQETNACRNTLCDIHQKLRLLQLALNDQNLTAVDELKILINATSFSLFERSMSLYDETLSSKSINDAWTTSQVPMMLYNTANLPRTVLNFTLLDATFTYHQRIQEILSTSSNQLDIEMNKDWNFVLENGITSIMDSYTNLEISIANEVRTEVLNVELAQIGLFAFGLLCFIGIYFFLFVPVITKAKTERETSLKAFLQIPRFVTQTLHAKYFDPETSSREDLNYEEENEKSVSWKSSLTTQTGYKRMNSISRNGLICVALFFAGAFGVDLWFLGNLMSIAGGISDTCDITARTMRILTVANDVANWGNSTFASVSETVPQTSKRDIILTDVVKILDSQAALLYGSSSPPHFENKFGTDLTWRIYPSDDANSQPVVYDSLANFIADSTIIANLETVSLNNSYVSAINVEQSEILAGYTLFMNDFLDWSDTNLKILVAVSYAVWAWFIVVIVATYFFFWRKIMNYLIKTENERTLKLLLMIPVEIVADIDSLRELLHLKRNTISANAAAAPPPAVNVMPAPVFPMSGRPSLVTNMRPSGVSGEISESDDEDMFPAQKAMRRASAHSFNTIAARKHSLGPSLYTEGNARTSLLDLSHFVDVPPLPQVPLASAPPKPIPRIAPVSCVTPSYRLSAGVQAFLQRESVTKRSSVEERGMPDQTTSSRSDNIRESRTKEFNSDTRNTVGVDGRDFLHPNLSSVSIADKNATDKISKHSLNDISVGNK
ncbi:hypothetical protein HDU83_007364 [Entophlyctis luteolus]|nr:hypothetical protein HDU82_000670 [Entophlyctis luteolus]KAJ3357433.1 hypothetical protein HDU83_007364 [Entophlyctis luteolus]